MSDQPVTAVVSFVSGPGFSRADRRYIELGFSPCLRLQGLKPAPLYKFRGTAEAVP